MILSCLFIGNAYLVRRYLNIEMNIWFPTRENSNSASHVYIFLFAGLNFAFLYIEMNLWFPARENSNSAWHVYIFLFATMNFVFFSQTIQHIGRNFRKVYLTNWQFWMTWVYRALVIMKARFNWMWSSDIYMWEKRIIIGLNNGLSVNCANQCWFIINDILKNDMQ